MEVIRKGILGDDSGQGSIEYLLISIGALVIAGIFFYVIRDTVQEHTLSISSHYHKENCCRQWQQFSL